MTTLHREDVLAERIDSYADAAEVGSQMQSDLYAAATFVRKAFATMRAPSAPVSEEREELAEVVEDVAEMADGITPFAKEKLWQVVALLRAPQQQAEPVAWRYPGEVDGDGWYIVDSPHRPAEVGGWKPLYAAPPPDSEAIALIADLVRQIDRFAELEGEADFYTGDARRFLSRKDQR